MFVKLHTFYASKVDKILNHFRNSYLPVQKELSETDIFKANILALEPDVFFNFNNSSNAVFTVHCDESKILTYCNKLRDITATIASSKDVYSLLYTSTPHLVKVNTFLLASNNDYLDEVASISSLKSRAFNYISAYNRLKDSSNDKDQLNYLRLTNFTNNLNQTVCSFLKLQTSKV